MLKLLGLFITIPLIEIIIMVRIGSEIGFWPTLALIVIPGFIGAAMARSQGLAVIAEIKRDLAWGMLPGDKIIDGILLLAGGLLLITPGIITDILGLSVLIPGMRRVYRGLIVNRLRNLISAGSFGIYVKR